MQVTVELQDNYSLLPIFLLILLVMVGIIVLFVWASKGPKEEKKVTKKTPLEPVVNPRSRAMELKRKYDMQLLQLSEDYGKQTISDRETYQSLSRIVRDFAYEMTGVKVQNYTLQELRSIGMPNLTALIEECYIPEFALDNCQSDAMDSINKARKVIGEWI